MQQDIKHFFCYDKRLAQYIELQGYQAVTKAFNSSNRPFTLFVCSDELDSLIKLFKQLNKNTR